MHKHTSLLDTLHLTATKHLRNQKIVLFRALRYFDRVTPVRMMTARRLNRTPNVGDDTSRGVLRNGATKEANVHYH